MSYKRVIKKKKSKSQKYFSSLIASIGHKKVDDIRFKIEKVGSLLILHFTSMINIHCKAMNSTFCANHQKVNWLINGLQQLIPTLTFEPALKFRTYGVLIHKNYLNKPIESDEEVVKLKRHIVNELHLYTGFDGMQEYNKYLEIGVVVLKVFSSASTKLKLQYITGYKNSVTNIINLQALRDEQLA